MLQRILHSILGIAKESIKTFCLEFIHNVVNLINFLSALVLAVVPGKASILEGIHGWELQPTLRAPRLPVWMANEASSFNELIQKYADTSNIPTELDSESGTEDDDMSTPVSPFSEASSSWHERDNSYGFIRKFANIILWPLRSVLNAAHSSSNEEFERTRSLTSQLRRSSSSDSINRVYGLASKQFTSMRDYVVSHTTDRRRGIVEDVHFLIELSIERIFEVLQHAVYYFFSPLEVLRILTDWIFFNKPNDDDGDDDDDHDDAVITNTTTIGDTDPMPSEGLPRASQLLNTDARTCEDYITELGYPYEALKVVTADGYVLLLERIPRRHSLKVVYLQHGMFDSALNWVWNGAVGSQAFAAYDQGYDVFLGNLRGVASREHIDKKISRQRYWKFTINELATQDVATMINQIHDIKVDELKRLQIISNNTCNTIEKQPYSLCGIAHSLGGAVMLMYIVTRRMENKPHRLSRVILLSPAGFHKNVPIPLRALQHIAPAMAPVLSRIIPGIYIPTKFFRMLFNKFARDARIYPAFGGLVQILFSYLNGGDTSNWVQAMGLTHYNIHDMPGVSYTVILHLSQMRSADKFLMYNYGNPSANLEVYGTPEPLDIGENYDLIDIPVDLVAGRKDKLIPTTDVKQHYRLLKQKGCQVSYKEVDYPHIDLVVASPEALLSYVVSKLLLVTSPISDVARNPQRKGIKKLTEAGE